jgi:hypothetical protein
MSSRKLRLHTIDEPKHRELCTESLASSTILDVSLCKSAPCRRSSHLINSYLINSYLINSYLINKNAALKR